MYRCATLNYVCDFSANVVRRLKESNQKVRSLHFVLLSLVIFTYRMFDAITSIRSPARLVLLIVYKQ